MPNPIPQGYEGAIPYLNIKGAAEAMEFYKKAFNAKEIGRITMAGGIIGHAEMSIGAAKIMLAEENSAWGNKAPGTIGGSPVCITVYVEDVDALFAQALAAGAKVTGDMTVQDKFYGDRTGSLTDPFGHQWSLMTHKEDVSFEEMQRRADAMFKEHKTE